MMSRGFPNPYPAHTLVTFANLPIAVPEKISGLALSLIFLTAATRSPPFIRNNNKQGA
jgi:hypothetical protein